jgi:hypothetical protein
MEVALEYLLDLAGFALSQKAVIHKDACQRIAYCAVSEHRGH